MIRFAMLAAVMILAFGAGCAADGSIKDEGVKANPPQTQDVKPSGNGERNEAPVQAAPPLKEPPAAVVEAAPLNDHVSCFRVYKEACEKYTQARKEYENLLAKLESGNAVTADEKNAVIQMCGKVIDLCAGLKKPLAESGDVMAGEECDSMASNAARDRNDLMQIETE